MKDIYNNLLEQYNRLSEEEKNSINIYKSSLFYHINSISSVDDFEGKDSVSILENLDNKNEFISKYKKYKEIVNDSKNLFLKYSVFKDIDFSDLNAFINSIKRVYNTLDRAKNKILLPKDIVVYRGCSYKDDEYDISKGNLVSTSTNLDVVEKFLYTSLNNKNILYEIELEKDTPILITPYSIVNVFESEIDSIMKKNSKQLKIINTNNSQEEIILFKDSLNFEVFESININNKLKQIKITTDVIKNDNNIKKRSI